MTNLELYLIIAETFLIGNTILQATWFYYTIKKDKQAKQDKIDRNVVEYDIVTAIEKIR